MCGITYTTGERERAESAISLIAHRGPDRQEAIRAEQGYIGAARLAITDIARGAQPVTTADGYVGAFNGEVYNHRTLREILEQEGRTFNTECDTEVVINAVAERGNRAARDFDGQFAYVVEDPEGTVYAGRDHFGIRPLYYGEGSEGFVMGSEISVLLNNNVPAEEIRQLPQGCTLEKRADGTTEIDQYYDVREQIKEESADPRRLYGLLEQAVEKRVPKEVDHAVILSGIDSSTVAYLAHQMGKKPKKSYTVATDPDSDDLKCARLMEKQLGIKGEVGYIDEEFVKRHLREVIRAMGTPHYFPLINAFPTLKLAQMAKRDEIKVILTGSGSDEVNMGYDYLWELFDPQYLQENAMNLVRSIGNNECHREDRLLASQGIEGRVPFLDKDLVEYALSTPFNERLPERNSAVSKWQLREAMRGKLPDYIVNRKKEALYRSTGVIPLMDRVAEELMSNEERDNYMESLAGTGWERWIVPGNDGKPRKMAVILHKTWAEEFPELAKVPLKDITCGFQETPPFEDLDALSKYWTVAGGGINLQGWNGGVK